MTIRDQVRADVDEGVAQLRGRRVNNPGVGVTSSSAGGKSLRSFPHLSSEYARVLEALPHQLARQIENAILQTHRPKKRDLHRCAVPECALVGAITLAEAAGRVDAAFTHGAGAGRRRPTYPTGWQV